MQEPALSDDRCVFSEAQRELELSEDACSLCARTDACSLRLSKGLRSSGDSEVLAQRTVVLAAERTPVLENMRPRHFLD